MSIQPCPECQTLAVRWLETLSNDAQVNYYRCEGCRHVWTLPKGDGDAILTAITHAKDADDYRVCQSNREANRGNVPDYLDGLRAANRAASGLGRQIVGFRGGPTTVWTGDCAEEQARLIGRTAELQAQTLALDVSIHPFSHAEHDVLRENLRQHRRDLADFRRRCLG